MRRMREVGERALQQYSRSHQHPVNRACHLIGIPLIAGSIVIFGAAVVASRLWLLGAALFAVGWLLQFAGHAAEGKLPAFLRDWRFVLLGLRWWCAEVRAASARR